MATKKATYQYDNGTNWDEIMFKTTADQVVESSTKRFVSDTEKSNWNDARTKSLDWDNFKNNGGKINNRIVIESGNKSVYTEPLEIKTLINPDEENYLDNSIVFTSPRGNEGYIGFWKSATQDIEPSIYLQSNTNANIILVSGSGKMITHFKENIYSNPQLNDENGLPIIPDDEGDFFTNYRHRKKGIVSSYRVMSSGENLKTTIESKGSLELVTGNGPLWVMGNFLPWSNNNFSIGTPSYKWSDLWIGSHSSSLNGYTKLPNGMIKQWGYMVVQDSANYSSVTLPVAYNNNNYNISITPYASSITGFKVSHVNSTSFGCNADSPIYAFYWTTIGWME